MAWATGGMVGITKSQPASFGRASAPRARQPSSGGRQGDEGRRDLGDDQVASCVRESDAISESIYRLSLTNHLVALDALAGK